MPLSIDSTSSASSIQSTAPQFGPQVSLVNANDIIAYVTMALGNIGDQLNDYKELVMKQQSDAKEIREALVLARQLNANGGDFTDKDMPTQGQNYNEMMTKMSHHLDDPNVRKAYEQMLSSFGEYTSTDTNQVIGKKDSDGQIMISMDEIKQPMQQGAPNIPGPKLPDNGLVVNIKQDINTQDHIMDKGEMDTFVNSLNDALSGLNSGNELMMMNLQNLMQVRNQISQFGSNNLKTLNDTESGIISNMK